MADSKDFVVESAVEIVVAGRVAVGTVVVEVWADSMVELVVLKCQNNMIKLTLASKIGFLQTFKLCKQNLQNILPNNNWYNCLKLTAKLPSPLLSKNRYNQPGTQMHDGCSTGGGFC